MGRINIGCTVYVPSERGSAAEVVEDCTSYGVGVYIYIVKMINLRLLINRCPRVYLSNEDSTVRKS
jgi:hypothetical protein